MKRTTTKIQNIQEGTTRETTRNNRSDARKGIKE
jgi:hypothetical protein